MYSQALFFFFFFFAKSYFSPLKCYHRICVFLGLVHTVYILQVQPYVPKWHYSIVFFRRSSIPLCLYLSFYILASSDECFGCFSVRAVLNCAAVKGGVCVSLYTVVLSLYQPGVQLLNCQMTVYFSLRNLHPVLLMSVSSFHFLPHCTSILFCAAPSPSAIVCNHSVMGILLIGNTLLLICNSLVRSNMVCVFLGTFFCV